MFLVMVPLDGILAFIAAIGIIIGYLLAPWVFSIIKFVKKDKWSNRIKGQIVPLILSLLFLILSIVVLATESKTISEKDAFIFMTAYYALSLAITLIFFIILCVRKQKYLQQAEENRHAARQEKWSREEARGKTMNEFETSRFRHIHRYYVDGHSVSRSTYEGLVAMHKNLDSGNITKEQYEKAKTSALRSQY